jgi:DNA-binding GntR family transcriptional regulator
MTRMSAAGATTSDAAYREIKSWILAGEIPLGMRLGEERVATRLSISRTPVREALLRLYAERFVERHPEGGYRISHPTSATMFELYDVRKALELFAVRKAVGVAAERRSALEELHEEWVVLAAEAPENDPGFVALDEDFHRRLAATAGNQELVAALERVCERIRPVRTHDFVTPGRIAATVEQHLGIVEAVIAGSARAEALLEAHIHESQSCVEVAVGRALERMLTTTDEGLTW